MKPRIDILKKKRAKNGRWYFVRIAPNGEQIFRSQLYKSRSGRNKAVNRIAENERVNIILQ